MPLAPTVFPHPRALGQALAEVIATGIEVGDRYVLGCPGGRSAMTTYAALAELVAARRLDLSGLVIAMMDDYVEPAHRTFVRVAEDLPHSCRRFGLEVIVAPLSEAAGQGRGIAPEHFWMPDPADPPAFDKLLNDEGGVDLFILASGASDGHVAFNPPGTPDDSGTRIVALAETTRRDNLATFPTLETLDNVPRHGVTVGIATIRRFSKQAAMIVHGADKREAAKRLSKADAYDPTWPATVIADCAHPTLLIDEAAQEE